MSPVDKEPYLVRVPITEHWTATPKCISVCQEKIRDVVIAYSQIYTVNEKKYKEDDSVTQYWYERNGKMYVVVPRWLAKDSRLKFEEL